MSFMDYLALPGSPAWLSPLQPLSKCDVVVYYTHNLYLDAIRDELSAPPPKK